MILVCSPQRGRVASFMASYFVQLDGFAVSHDFWPGEKCRHFLFQRHIFHDYCCIATLNFAAVSQVCVLSCTKLSSGMFSFMRSCLDFLSIAAPDRSSCKRFLIIFCELRRAADGRFSWTEPSDHTFSSLTEPRVVRPFFESIFLYYRLSNVVVFSLYFA